MGKLARFIHYYTEDNYGGNRPDPFNTFKGQIIRFMAKEAKPIKKITAPFAPAQNLNGQDAPYPPGGGKNLLDPTTASGLTKTVWFCEPDGFLFKAGVTYTLSVLESIVVFTRVLELRDVLV